jgi:hypothetical protein
MKTQRMAAELLPIHLASAGYMTASSCSRQHNPLQRAWRELRLLSTTTPLTETHALEYGAMLTPYRANAG